MVEIQLHKASTYGLNSLSKKDKECIYAEGGFIIRNVFDESLIDQVHSALYRLFALDESVKMRYRADKFNDPLCNGFSPYGIAKALDTGIPNLLETWDISDNRSNWPDSLLGEWETIIALQAELKQLSLMVLCFIADLIGVTKDQLYAKSDVVNEEGIHLIHYPPLKKNEQLGARRQSEHYDMTVITLIPAPFPIHTGISYKTAGQWKQQKIEKTNCLVQFGKVLEILTGGSLKSNIHTVPNPTFGTEDNVSRYSTPFFVGPNPQAEIEPLTKFTSSIAYANVSGNNLVNDYLKKIF